ncbi:MAG: glycoside hydrolase family 2 TIM barrel-domain containing protein [Candidatus Omnitrophota bacterium]
MKKFLVFLLILNAVVCVSGFGADKKIVEERGGRTKVVKYNDGSWELLVDGKPFFIKGVIFCPVKIGEWPQEATMRDWMYYDDDNDGRNDIACQTWVDKNKNNKQDADEKLVGDFELLRELGCNVIRLYHVASDSPLLGQLYKTNPSTELQFDHKVNKELLRSLYADYGIKVMVGNFLGSWTIGSGASWEEGTDYTNPAHRENIKTSVRAMVEDNKDEPYVLMWVLGNENNIATWSKCNANKQPEAYAKLVGEIADMIHQMDPEHPVAVCDGDNFNTLKMYAEYAKSIDVIAYNSYRGKSGFGALWKNVKRIFDRPVFISEFGMFSYNTNKGEDEQFQANYIRNNWNDIALNSYFHMGKYKKCAGNSLGGVVFDWIDRWYMDGNPQEHDLGTRSWDSPDKLLHEEWFGIVSMGNGDDPLMRQKKAAYDYLKKAWNYKKSD